MTIRLPLVDVTEAMSREISESDERAERERQMLELLNDGYSVFEVAWFFEVPESEVPHAR